MTYTKAESVASSGFGRGIGRTLLATSFGFALIQLDVTVVNVALPHIGASLGTSVAGLQWIVDGYALVFAALLLTAGFFGDRFGGRDRKSTRLNSSHSGESRMPSSA